jgi:hypothetical protein
VTRALGRACTAEARTGDGERGIDGLYYSKIGREKGQSRWRRHINRRASA